MHAPVLCTLLLDVVQDVVVVQRLRDVTPLQQVEELGRVRKGENGGGRGGGGGGG